MSGSRVKKNEEINRYDCYKCQGIRELTIIIGSTPENYDEKNVLCPICGGTGKDITLMIEQMGAMKDQIEQLTKERDEVERRRRNLVMQCNLWLEGELSDDGLLEQALSKDKEGV